MTFLQILSFFWPRMTLARFEKAYRAAVVKHGEERPGRCRHNESNV